MRRSLLLASLLALCACPPPPPVNTPDGSPGGPPDADTDACVPASCGAFNCGSIDDGCGGTRSCGSCTLPETCGGAGTDRVCGVPPCEPEPDSDLCLAAGRNCGPWAAKDRCGNDRTAHCGECTSPETCGGSGAAGVCGDGTCTETDAELCKRFGKDCDAFQARDLCNQPRIVECGSCTAPDTCGYGGNDNVCGRCWTPETDAQLCERLQTSCGSITATDLCGDLRTVHCGDCPDAACVVGCPDGCTPESAQELCGRLGKNCGTVTDTDAHCGSQRTVYCGFCGAPNTCGADNVCACQPKTCDELAPKCGKIPDDCGAEIDCPCSGATPPYCIRIAAANITSGNKQSYDPGEGTRIFQGLKPDVVLIQEFNYAWNTDQDIRNYVSSTFGAHFWHWREPGDSIPNGVISRFPIVAAGEWADTETPNRDFVWAHLDVPGPKDLWVVSLHLMTSTAGTRASETSDLVTYIKANVPTGDFLVIGGDLNTGSRTETSITNLKSVVLTGSPWPADGKGNTNTNASRSSPLDWVMVNSALDALETPLKIGSNTFNAGLVFDSRIYTPLADVWPVQKTDSDATNMQHMLVARDFCLPLQ